MATCLDPTADANTEDVAAPRCSAAVQGLKALGPEAPLPPLAAIQVGLIGHRLLTPEQLNGLQEPVCRVLADIREAALAAVAGSPAVGPLRLRAVCALAEGADVLLADAALALGFSLAAPLPFSRETYRASFETEAMRETFDRLLDRAETVYELDGVPGSAEVYRPLGRVLLGQSDLVVAIWDGQIERGPGGTGEILHEAWLADVPAVVIGSQAPHAVRWYDPAADGEVFRIHPLLRRMLVYSPPKGIADDLAPFLAERLDGIQRPHLGTSPAGPTAPWEEFANALSKRSLDALAAAAARIDAAVGPHFTIADGLAIRYSRLYRLSFTLRYLVGIPTMLGQLLAIYGPPTWSRAGFAIVLATTIAILAIYAFDRLHQWHRRFLDYRFLAEHLRALKIMALFGSTVTLQRPSIHHVPDRSDWVWFRLRAIVRSVGLVEARVGPSYLEGVRAVLANEVAGQLAFYEDRAARYGVLATWLQRIGLSFSVLAFAIGMLRNAIAVHGSPAGDSMAVLAIVLPALGGVVIGLHSQAEYSRLSERYRSMARELRRLRDALASEDVRRNRVDHLAQEMANVILAEVSDWRVLIRAKGVAPF